MNQSWTASCATDLTGMRILRVIGSMAPSAGGPPQGIRNLLPALEEKGVEQVIACLDPPGEPGLEDDCFMTRTLGPAKTSWAYSGSLRPWLRKHLRNFDAVICHGLWQFPLMAVRWEVESLRRQGDAPRFFIYPHGMLDPWFQRDPSRRVKAWRNEIYWWLAERHNINSADAVLFTCEEERRLAGSTFPGYQATEKVVGYGVPDPPASTPAMREAFLKACPGLHLQRPYLLFLSRVHPKKGVDLLIRAYAKVVRGLVDPPDLVIAGPLHSTYAKEMQALATRLLAGTGKSGTKQAQPSAAGRIFFPGMLQGKAKWGALHGAKAFILPSHQENFGIAVVEALACGTPVMISNRVNIWRSIAAAEAGVVEDDTMEGAERLVASAIDMDPEEAEKMGRRGRGCFEREFSCVEAARRLCRVLQTDSPKGDGPIVG